MLSQIEQQIGSQRSFSVAEIMDFSTDITSIDDLENPSDLQLSQASAVPFSQHTFIDMIPESTLISNDYSFYEDAVSAASPCMPTSADDIEIFQRTLAGNWCTLIVSLSWFC